MKFFTSGWNFISSFFLGLILWKTCDLLRIAFGKEVFYGNLNFFFSYLEPGLRKSGKWRLPQSQRSESVEGRDEKKTAKDERKKEVEDNFYFDFRIYVKIKSL